jgi:hypothetical protein
VPRPEFPCGPSGSAAIPILPCQFVAACAAPIPTRRPAPEGGPDPETARSEDRSAPGGGQNVQPEPDIPPAVPKVRRVRTAGRSPKGPPPPGGPEAAASPASPEGPAD